MLPFTPHHPTPRPRWSPLEPQAQPHDQPPRPTAAPPRLGGMLCGPTLAVNRRRECDEQGSSGTALREPGKSTGAGGVPEAPFDADTNASTFHGTGTSGTGGAATDNHEFIAGVASTGGPVFITMLRLADPPGTTILATDLVDALAWCIDHQHEREGPGPINMSVNAAPPHTINSSAISQNLTQTLRAQGDLVVNGEYRDSGCVARAVHPAGGRDGREQPAGKLLDLRAVSRGGAGHQHTGAPRSRVRGRHITVDRVLVRLHSVPDRCVS